VYDGVMFPQGDTAQVIAAATWAREIPVILGGNRDEQKAYQYADPTLVEAPGTDQARIIEPARYAAFNRYYSGWWTAMGVNELAEALTALGHPQVFAYRFDWDDLTTQPVDLKTLIGAAHALELPFVFGDFSVSYLSDLVFTPANFEGRARLSSTMMSYWSEFALNGDPGRGRRHDLPHWRAWRSGRHNKLIFDEIGGGGVRMVLDPLDTAGLYARMFADPDLRLDEKCRMYALFTMYPRYDLDGWDRYGCSGYVINSIKSWP
jgi:para-nitrobenzyl esterase